MMTPSFNLDWTTGLTQPIVNVTRAGVATFFGSNGLIQLSSADTQRIDWSTGTAGLLIEESRQNQLKHSSDFTNILWSFNQSSASSDETNSPDGTVTADKFVENLGTVAPFVLQNSSVTSGVTYTQTVFAKSAERSVLQFAGSTGFLSSRCNFDLSTGLLGSNDTGGVASIVNVGNGWYRCSLSLTATSTSASGRIAIAIVSSPTSSRFATYTGDGTSGLYIWGAQLEEGSFPTSYIPTTTTAVTRNADVATITGTNFSDFWQAGKGGVLVRARPGTVSGVRPWVQFDDGTADNLIAIRGNGTDPELYIVDSTTPQAQIDAGTIAANTDYAMTAWWNTDDCKARLNSGAVVSDTSATIPTVDQMRIGSDGTNYLNGHIASIGYYDRFSSQIYTRRKNKAVFSLL